MLRWSGFCNHLSRQMLYLEPMNLPSRRPVILFLLYLLIAIGLTVVAIRKEVRSAAPSNQEMKDLQQPPDKI